MIFQVKDVIVHDIWYDHLRTKKQKRHVQTMLLWNFNTQENLIFQEKKISVHNNYISIHDDKTVTNVNYYTINNIHFSFVENFKNTNEDSFFNAIQEKTLNIQTIFHKNIENAHCFDKDIQIQIKNDVVSIHRKSGSLNGITGLKLLTRQRIYHNDSSESFGGYITYITHETDQLWLTPLLKNNIPVRVIATEEFDWLTHKNIDVIYAKYENSEWILSDQHQNTWNATSLFFSNNNHEGFEINLQLDLEGLSNNHIENMWFKPLESDYANQFGISYSYNNDVDNISYQKILKINSHIDLCRNCTFKQTCINIEGPRHEVTTPLNISKCSILLQLKK